MNSRNLYRPLHLHSVETVIRVFFFIPIFLISVQLLRSSEVASPSSKWKLLKSLGILLNENAE